jgi:hypothetical protein
MLLVSRKAALCVLLIVFVVVLASTAESKKHFQRRDFKARGGALKFFGAARLDRIRRRAGRLHKTTEELAKQLDTDDDVVGC